MKFGKRIPYGIVIWKIPELMCCELRNALSGSIDMLSGKAISKSGNDNSRRTSGRVGRRLILVACWS